MNRKGYCYIIAVFAYVVGVIEIIYAMIMLVHYGENYILLWALAAAWIPILIAGICLVIGTCMSHSHMRCKRTLLRTWIAVALSFGFAIIIIKIWLIVSPYEGVGIWRNILRICVFCCFLLLVYSFIYFPCLYVHELEEQMDF